MSTHFREVCQFGVVHNQCRCPGNRIERTINCDRPSEHSTLTHVVVETGTPLPLRGNPFLEQMPDLDKMESGEFLNWAGTDPVRWARAFQHFDGRTSSSADTLLNLVAWFDNAITAGKVSAVNLPRSQRPDGQALMHPGEQVKEF